jgi:hypothetical protein
VVSFTAGGTSGAPPAALAAGLYYWRLHGTWNGAVGSATSPVWEFSVGARSAPVDTSWGTTPDVNGDGLSDVVVGAPETGKYAGAAYVYIAGSGGLSSTPVPLTSPAGGATDLFGTSVASAGDVNGDGFADVIVGAPGVMGYTGTAYLYLGGPGGLSHTPSSLPSPAGYSAEFGYVIAGAGDLNADGYADVIVGGTYTNTVYVFLGAAGGPLTSPLTLLAPAGAVYFGQVVAAAGDVNGDGFADILVGAPGMDSGNAYLYLGEASGVSGAPQVLTWTGSPQVNNFGRLVAGAGDVNGDGFADVVVGTGAGPTSLYLGGSGGLSMMPALLSLSGYQLAGAGDVNGDGFGDVLVGGQSSGGGAASVYLGGASGLSQMPEVLTTSSASILNPGYVVAGAGDVNGDGLADVLVGAPTTSGGGAYVFFGASAGPSTMPDIVLMGAGQNTWFGRSVARSQQPSARRKTPR